SMRLTGLTPGTDYAIKLRSINGNDISSWNTTASFTTLAEYPMPAGLTATLTPGDGTIATLNWTEPGNATDWVLEYGMDADFQGAVSLNVSGTPVADLTDLIPKSTYYARVKAIYNDDNSESPWSNTLVFYPTDSYSHTVYDGDKTGYAPIEGSKCDSYVKSQFIIHAEDLTAIQHATINRLTFYSYYESCDWGTAEFEVYMTEVDYKRLSPDYWADWDKMDLVRNAGRLSVSNHKMVVTLDEPFQYMGGNLLIAFSQTEPGTASYASWWGDDIDNGTILTGYEDRFSCYYGLPKTTIDYTPADVSTMLKPTDLTVAVEGSTAMLSWKENGNATSWIVAYKAEGDTEYREVAEVAENSYTLTGLDLATEYRVKVRAKKGSELSFWSEHTDFRTDFCEPENMCAVSITLTDAFGYGWSSDRLMVVDEKTGVVLGSYALAAGSSETFEINVCIGRTINFVYEASNSTQYSHGYIIKDAQGDLICEHEGCNQYGACDAPTVGVIATYTVSCTPAELMRPNGLTVSENGPHSVKLSWIDHSLIPITSWVVAYKTVVATDFTEVNVTIAEEELPTPAYILTGLAPETQYIVKVRPASNDIVKWSSDVTFTTTEAYTVPVDVAVSDVANHKVTASWTGNNDATAYNLRYRPVQGFYYGFETVEPWAVDTFAPCGTMDGDKCNTRFFTSYSFPNQGYVGACIAFQNMNDNLYANSGNAFGAMFCPFDNNTRADDRFVLPEINVQDGYIFSFWVRSAMHQIGPEQINVEIFEGVSPISSVSFQTSSALWTQYSIDLSPYAGKNIRIGIHYTSMSKLGVMFDDIYVGNPGDATGFTTITGVTAPYQLTGLDENTSYEIQVQAVYGEEGESDWPWVAFTTVTPTIALADNATGNSETISYYDGETAKVTLAGRTLYKDGEWNTICLPFTVALEGSPLDGAIAKTLTDATITGTTVGLSFGNPDSETEPVTTLQAGVPYIIKWEKTEGYDEADATTRDIQNPLFQNVTVVSGSAADRTITKADGHVKFIGYYDAFNIDTPANDDIYYLTAGNTLKHTGKARTLNACRAYFQFSEAAAARHFVLDFGSDASGIKSIDNLRLNTDIIYDLSGRRIKNQQSLNRPLPKGLYIRNGKKVVMK
ncbi:MAG: fibronectin type III domain-containing protein, partial [Prevotella sp.]|nr:fibronectin type III domain-containing protein [Prevotella sp.]